MSSLARAHYGQVAHIMPRGWPSTGWESLCGVPCPFPSLDPNLKVCLKCKAKAKKREPQ